ncbi:PAS domain S-box protein [Aneurinibacillus sp. REN35]|uniref:PAS domain S-box protein n=1 Tax=Aneurinibacillus sp. REN35 TaxID=3237286 RepID=UPI0035275E77
MNHFIAVDAYTNTKVERMKLEQEWEQFVYGSSTQPAVRPLMHDSWRRCLEQNINPLHNRVPVRLSKKSTEEFLTSTSLHPILKPILTHIKDTKTDANQLVTITNDSGDIVYLDGPLPLLVKAEDMNFVIGSSWAEHHAGTNAIGTSLVTGVPIQVFAGEHFCQEVQKWTCSAAPIRDPATRDIMGVINLTGLWKTQHPSLLSVVMGAVHTVEQSLYTLLEYERFRLEEHFNHIISLGIASPVLVMDRGGNVVKASPVLYEQGWITPYRFLHGAPTFSFPILTSRQWKAECSLHTWHFELTPYMYGGAPIGAVVWGTPQPYALSQKCKNHPAKTMQKSQLAASTTSIVQASSKREMESSEWHCSLFKHNPHGILCLDAEGNILQANPAAEKLFGYAAEELQGRSAYSLAIPEEQTINKQHFMQAAGGKIQEYETLILHRQGHDIHVSVESIPMCTDHGIVGAYGIFKDITRHKQLEEDLQSTKEQLDLFLRNTVDSIVVLDLQFNVVKINRAFERKFGWNERDIIGGPLPTIPPSLYNEFIALFQEIISTRHMTSYETVRQNKDGTLIDVNVFVSPISDTKGNIVAFVATLCDITERKRMEEALKERETQLRTLINAMPDIVCFKDAEGRWIEANEFCLRVLQMDTLSYQGKHDNELAVLHNQYREMFLHCAEVDEQVWQGGSKTRSEEVISQGIGEPKVFDVIKVPLFHTDGQRKGIVTIGRDITDLKRTEELLRKSEKLSIVGKLAAGVAHEIRNPLTSIKGFIQFIREGHSKDEYFSMILSELDRIEQIVNEFLVLAKPQVMNVKYQSLSFLLQQVIDLLNSQALMNNVQILTDFAPDLPMIKCEDNQLKQVFINVLKNALEAMPHGGVITVELTQERNAQRVRIIDQGSGISEDRIQKLGEPFYTTKEKGTGLGLMISYKIVQAHRGTIRIMSREKKGTTVEIMLPLS